ncbi:MAG: YfiR family protein [Pseudomonadota bacterium]|nr:YfiR family protein [Pseudomonadota bacterium]
MLGRRYRCVLVAFATLFATLFPTGACGQTREYALKAEFLERFTQFVDWPKEAFPDPGAAFVLCVVGQNPFGSLLEEMARARRFGRRRGEVRYLGDLARLHECHLVWVSRAEKHTLDVVLAQTGGRPILTVGDTPGYAEAGVLINFFIEQDRIRFEINHLAAQRGGLVFSSQLLRLARVVP